MNKGYIYLERKTWDNPVVNKDKDHFYMWIYLLFRATHTERKILFGKETQMLNRGQVLTSRKRISKDCAVHESKVERILKSFETEQQIRQVSNSRSRIITILRYDEYQKKDNKSDNNRTHRNNVKVIMNKERRDDLSGIMEIDESPIAKIWVIIHKRFNLDEWAYPSYQYTIDKAIKRLGDKKLEAAIKDFMKDKDPSGDCSTLQKFMNWGVDEYVAARVKVEKKKTTDVWCTGCDSKKEVPWDKQYQTICQKCERQMLAYEYYKHEKNIDGSKYRVR